MEKILLNRILLTVWLFWLTIISLYIVEAVKKPTEPTEFKERKESLYKNESDTLQTTNYFTND